MNAYLTWHLFLGSSLAAAVYFDVRYRRIPNALSLTTLATGLLFALAAPPGHGLFSRLDAGSVGFLVTIASTSAVFGLLFLCYVGKVMGAGDVKYISAVASFFGGWAVTGLLVSILAAGGGLAAVRMLDGKIRSTALRNLRSIWFSVGVSSRGASFDPRRDTADHLPYGVAIAIGTVAYSAWLWHSGG